MTDSRRGAESPYDDERRGPPPDDQRQQPWTGSDPARAVEPHDPITAPAEQVRPEQSGVRSGRDDEPDKPGGGIEARRPVDLNAALPPQPGSPDEVTSEVAPDDPGAAREDNRNPSDSSGLRAGDEADGERIRELHRRGATEISRMD